MRTIVAMDNTSTPASGPASPGHGQMQSPIDLAAAPSSTGDGLSIAYHHLTKATFRDGLGTLTVLPHPGGVMGFKG